MSRVDDDRDAARAAERLMQQRRADEAKKTSRAAQDNAFSKLVGQQKGESLANAARQGAAKGEEAKSAKDAIAQLLEQAGETKSADETANLGRGDQARANAQKGARSFDDRVKAYSQGAEQKSQGVKDTDRAGDEQLSLERAADDGNSAALAGSRGAESKAYTGKLDQRKSDSDAAKKGQPSPAAGGARAEKGDLKADADKGGGGQGKNDGKGGEAAAAAGFRFNPALMAPVPVAQANKSQGSDRLRRIASEIAQKIVEKVRVGTNQAGKMEFQIDFRQDVLSGLSVKVSAKNGKISAVFSGRDKEVLKMLEEQAEGLKSALSSRGLSLEDFKVEAKA